MSNLEPSDYFRELSFRRMNDPESPASFQEVYTRSRKPRSRLFLWMAVAGIIIVVTSGLIGLKFFPFPPPPPPPCITHSSKPVTLTMYYDPEMQTWIEEAAKEFNIRHNRACDGPITIQATPRESDQAMQDILLGNAKPDVWISTDKIWLTLLNSQWQTRHNGQQLIGTQARDTPSLITSPIVIAMWQPEAEALGWPQKPISWSDIAKLSNDPNGWSTYHHPESGQFKFGHTNPDFSNSGLDAVIAMNYAMTGKVYDLTLNDVNSSSTKNLVSSVESSVIYYGDSTQFLATEMFTRGPGYLSATVMEENLVVNANNGKTYHHLPYPVVAIYPKEGTFSSDYPYAILNAPWVTPAQRAAGLVFGNFLLTTDQQKKALQYGFRPTNLKVPTTAPIDRAHYVDPKQPGTVLQRPNAEVVRSIQSNWNTQRRRVDVMLLLDCSGSMGEPVGDILKKDGGTKIELAKANLTKLVGILLSPDDEVGFTTFSTTATVVTPVSLLGPNLQTVIGDINRADAQGQTRLFDTIAEQQTALQNMPSKDIKALVVLTDGIDDASQRNIDQLVNQVKLTGENAGLGVKIFTIAYGDDANTNVLTSIANAAGGREYKGDSQDIQSIYKQISQFW